MRVFSVDLGNSETKVATTDRDGRSVIVPNEVGDLSTSSIAHIPDDALPVVGKEAANMAFLEPENVVRNWKRHMGSKTCLHKSKNGKEWLAKDIAALILDNVKKSIEKRTGEIVTEITITVPANYTEEQKGETIEAAGSAGLKATVLPTEPYAAALGNEIHLRGDGLTMVCDIGGGTTDISIVRVRGNLIEVIVTNGDPALGSQDVNRILREQALQMFQKEHGYVPSLAKSPLFYAELEAHVEQVKITLAARESASLIVRDGDKLLNLKITRKQLEEWCGDLVKRVMDLCERSLSEAHLTWADLTRILAVGGGSRMPVFPQELERLSGKKLSQNVEPNYAAALGGVIAARIELGRQGRRAETEAGMLPPLNFHSREVTSHSLGVSALNREGKALQNVLLPKGTPYPSVQVRKFALSRANQTAADIIILEGEEGCPEEKCIKLGQFHLEGLPAYPDITERIEITFDLDASGLLMATARDLKSGKTATMKIEYKSNGANGKAE